MSNPVLTDYIRSAKAKNVADDAIKSQLLHAGWNEMDVSQALHPSSFSGEALPPPPAPHISMWVGFLYIILFISLYVSATAVGGIMHNGVNHYIPDALDKAQLDRGNIFDSYMMKIFLSSIIVTYPVFVLLFLILKKQAKEKPVVKNLKSRKVLIYLTLVGTFVILAGHLISTVYGFLDGSTTLRSIAHLSVNALVAGAIFWYLIHEVREDRKAI